MKTKYLVSGLIFFLIAANIKLLLNQNTIKQQIEIENNSLKIANVKNDLNDYLFSYLPDQVKTELTNFDTLRVIGENNSSYLLKSISSSPILILRFRKDHCGTCIFQEITLLKELVAKNRLFAEKILVLGEFKTERDFRAMQTSLAQYDIPLYYADGNLGNALDTSPVPYAFVFNPASLSNHLTFVTEQKLPNKSKEYYLEVLKNL